MIYTYLDLSVIIHLQVIKWAYILTFVNLFLCLLHVYQTFGRYGVLWSYHDVTSKENGGVSDNETHDVTMNVDDDEVNAQRPSLWPWIVFQALIR